MPKVSVIVNTVDRPTDLKRCLEAVLNQTYRDFELVVVNNGTGEETHQLLTEFKSQFSIFNLQFKVIEDKTKKLSYLFNVGWKNADSSSIYFAYCADDTEPKPDWLSSAVAYLDGNALCGAVSGPTLSTTDPPGEMFYLRDLARKNIFTKIFLRVYEYFVMEDRTLDPGYWPESGAFTMGAGVPLPEIKDPIEIDLLTSGNMIVRREAMEKIKGFDENFYFNHADGDFFIRLKKAGYKLIFHPQVSVLHHMRFGPTRYPWILGRDTSFYYLKDVRPRSLRGFVGAFLNLAVFNLYFVFKAAQLRKINYLRGISGFFRGVLDFFLKNTAERNDLIATICVAGGFVALFSFVYRNLWHYGMLAYGDAVPFPSNIRQAFDGLTAAWDFRSPGTLIVPQIHILYSLLPVEILLMLLSGGDPVIAQRLFHYLPLPLSFLTIYLLLSRIGLSRPAKFFGGFIYSLNLFMVGEFLGGFEGNLYIQAFMPVFLYLIWKIYREESLVSTTLSYTLLLSLAYILSDHVFLFLSPFLIGLFLGTTLRSYRNKRWNSFFKAGFFLVFSHLSIFLITAYHSYYYFRVALPFLSDMRIPPHVLEFLKRNVDDTYRFFTLGNALRGGGSYFTNLFTEGVPWARTGFILPILAFSWLLFRSNRQGKKAIIGSFLTFLALLDLVFINYVGGERLSWLFNGLPFLFRFRNPSRPTFFLLLIYSILIPLTVNALAGRIRENFRKNPAVSAFFLIIVIVSTTAAVYYLKPAFSGDLTMGKNRGEGANLSQGYYDLGSWLKDKRSSEGFFRTLFVPWDHENAEIKLYWIEPYALAVPINFGAYLPNSRFLFEIKKVYEDLVKGENENMEKNLAEFGVKYVVLNSDSQDSGTARYAFDYQTPWLLGSPESFKSLIEIYSGMRYETTVDGFRIYRNDEFSAGRINKEKAGFPPENYREILQTHYRVLMVSVISFLFVLTALIYSRSRML